MQVEDLACINGDAVLARVMEQSGFLGKLREIVKALHQRHGDPAIFRANLNKILGKGGITTFQLIVKFVRE